MNRFFVNWGFIKINDFRVVPKIVPWYENRMPAQVETKYPLIEVDLSEAAGNVVAVMSQMRMALRAGSVPAAEISAFFDEALSQGYKALLGTCARWVRVKPMLIVVEAGAAEDEIVEAGDLAA